MNRHPETQVQELVARELKRILKQKRLCPFSL